MSSTLISRTATPCLAGALAMELQSVTAPGLGSVHGTRLPFAVGMTPASRTAPDAALQADVAGSPPRGGPV